MLWALLTNSLMDSNNDYLIKDNVTMRKAIETFAFIS